MRCGGRCGVYDYDDRARAYCSRQPPWPGRLFVPPRPGISVAADQMTMLMILPGTTITFFGALPSSHFCASG